MARRSWHRLRLAGAALMALAWLGAAAGQGQEYTVGPNDVLTVTVWGHADLSRDCVVDPDGVVAFPLVGRLKAAGLTPKDFAEQLRAALEKDYLVNPHVTVVVKEYLSQKVLVLGEAERPGVFHLTGPTTVLDILSRAGGPAKTAGRQLILMRNRSGAAGGPGAGGAGMRLSVDRIQAGEPADNVRMEDGDTLLLLKRNAFFVLGEVKRPGSYQLDRDTNVLEGITLAGGFTDKAAPGRTRVIRSTPEGQQVITVDLNDAMKRGRRDKAIQLRENDVVVVPESFF